MAQIEALLLDFGAKSGGECGICASGFQQSVGIFANFHENFGIFHVNDALMNGFLPGMLLLLHLVRFEANLAVSGGLQLTLKGGEKVEVSMRQARLFRSQS